jgi:hypothetical protein
MSARREELDDLIDRVAGAMTSVRSEPALVERVVGRLGASRISSFNWPQLVLVGAMAAIAAVTVTLLTTGNRDAVDTRVVSAPAPAPPPPAAAPAESSRGASDAPNESIARPRPTAPRMITHLRQVPQLDPIQFPELPAVGELSTAPLFVEPVAVEPLNVASLAAAEDARDQPKE